MKKYEKMFYEKLKKHEKEWKVISDYKGQTKPITAIHKPCGTEITCTANELFNKNCKKCKKQKTKQSHRENFYRKLKEHEEEWELLTDYKGERENITAIHKPCGTKRTCEARRLFTKGCRNCKQKEAGAQLAKETWEQHLPAIEGEHDVKFVTEYKGRREEISFMCNKCGQTITTWPEYILDRDGIICDHIKEIDKEILNQERKIRDIERELQKTVKEMQTLIEKREEMLDLCQQYHDNGYEIIKIYKNNKVKIKHSKCGRVYTTTKSVMKKGHGCAACARCGTSYGVQEIEEILKDNNIKYEREVKFDSCRNKLPLPFDFGIKNKYGEISLLIEYNGEQHYRPTKHFGGKEKHEKIKKTDKIKKEWAEAEGIDLLTIKYNENIREVIRPVLKLFKAERHTMEVQPEAARDHRSNAKATDNQRH